MVELADTPDLSSDAVTGVPVRVRLGAPLNTERTLAKKLIEHASGIYSVPNFMSKEECEALVAYTELAGFEKAEVRTGAIEDNTASFRPEIRNNERLVIEDLDFTTNLWIDVAGYHLPHYGSSFAVGLPTKLRFYKYSPGQRFKMHRDGAWIEGNLISRLTLLIYLNDDFEGGETDFRIFKIKPATGTLVLFEHDKWHEGAPVISGEKYVLRSDVLYSQELNS